jgi:hypothetical protein
MTSTQHTAHFYVHEYEKFKNAIQINWSHSCTYRKTYDAAQRHGLGDLPPQSDYSTTPEPRLQAFAVQETNHAGKLCVDSLSNDEHDESQNRRLQRLRQLGDLGKLNDGIKSEGQGSRREHYRYAHENGKLRRQGRGTNVAATTPTVWVGK